MHWVTRRAARRVLAMAMGTVWTVQPVLAAADGGALGRQFERSLMAVEDGMSNLPRDRFDPQYVVDQLGIEPETLFGWVKANIGWVPYAGTLRGAGGTLMERRGNALDRALLLAELLGAAGRDVRLARARLTPAQAEALWNEIAAADAVLPPGEASPGPPASGPTGDDGGADLSAVIGDYDLDPGTVAPLVEQAGGRARHLADDLFIRSVVHWGRLFDQGAVPREADAQARAAAARAALADHWWVEVEDGGAWIPLDTLAPSLSFGKTLLPPAETHAVDALPDGLAHVVAVRVVAEQIKDGTPQERTLIDYPLRAAQVIGQRIALRFMPTRWPPDWATTTPEVFQRQLRAAALTQTEWIPVLAVGEQQLADASILDTGEVNPKPDLDAPFGALGVPVAGGIGRVIDLFGEDDGTGEAAPGRAEGEFSALWIDYEIRVPGQPPRTVRRELFDLVGPARRASGTVGPLVLTDADRERRSVTMLGETQILIQTGEIAPEFMMQLAAEAALANRPFLEEMARDPFGGPKADLTETLQKMVPGPGSLDLLALARFAHSGVSDRVYIAEPNILTQHVEMVQDANRDFHGRLAIDIVANDVAVLPSAPGDAANLRLVQGVVDTNAELLVLADAPHLYGAAELFETVGAGGAAWVTLRPGDGAALAALPLPEDAAARIKADLAAGYAVVAPSQAGLAPIRVGYWRIDPATGTTLGMGANGWGVSLVEYAFVLVIKTMLAEMVCQAQAAIGAVAMAKLDKGSSFSVRNDGQKTFNKAAGDAFKFCMVTALFGGFMLMAQTPLTGGSMFPRMSAGGGGGGGSAGGSGGGSGGSGGTGGGSGGKNQPPGSNPPNSKPPGSSPPGSKPPPSQPPGSKPPQGPPSGPPGSKPPSSGSGDGTRPPSRADVQESLKNSRQKWDEYIEATKDKSTPGDVLNRKYEDAVRAEEAAKQKGFKDYVGDRFDTGAHKRLREWTEDSHNAYKGMEQPANTKVTPPGQTGPVDTGAITEVDRGSQKGPSTLPGTTGGSGQPSSGPPSSSGGGSGGGPPSSGGGTPPAGGGGASPSGSGGGAASAGWDGYPFASPGMDDNPPSYTPGYRPLPPPPSQGFPPPLDGGGPRGPQLTPGQMTGGGTDYPFGSPSSGPPTLPSPGATPDVSPAGFGLAGIAAGLKTLGQ